MKNMPFNVKIPTDPTKIAGAMENKVHLFSDMVVYSSTPAEPINPYK